MEQHPVAREAALGAFSGLGIPETMTPVRDLARGVAQLGAPPTTTGEKVSTALGVPVPAYRMAKGLAEQTYGLGKDVYQGLTSGDMAQAAHGGAGLATEAGSMLLGGKKAPEVADSAVSAARTAADITQIPSFNRVGGHFDAFEKAYGDQPAPMNKSLPAAQAAAKRMTENKA